MHSGSIKDRPNYSCRSIRSPQRGITTRKVIERREAAILSPRAMQSRASNDQRVWLIVASTAYPLDAMLLFDPPVHTIFAEDREKVNNSNAFRRLAGKTQVLIKPINETITTRLTHVLQVAQYARTVGRALGLNEDLIEAIALGHDLGHTPFGHAGERALNELAEEHLGGRYSFSHNRNSFRLGSEWGLSHEVLDGILRHSGKIARVTRPSPKIDNEDFSDADKNPMTLEGCLVKVMDKVASAAQDFFDLFHAGMISNDNAWHRSAIMTICQLFNLKEESIGNPHILHQAMVADIIKNSKGKKGICFSKRIHLGFLFLQGFVDGVVRGKIIDENKHIKEDPRIKFEDDKAKNIIRVIFGKRLEELKKPEELDELKEIERLKLKNKREELEHLYDLYYLGFIREIIESIALMTDQMAIDEFDAITKPRVNK